MAKKLTSSANADEEDYIEMEVSSCSNYDCYSISSPQHSTEFEFPMSRPSLQRVPSISPADELFYKGKLLPLHLPPRLQMVQKLLQNSNTPPTHENKTDNFRENYKNPSINAKITCSSTPLESCNVSPSRSCRVSRELNPNEYFFECSSEVISFIDDQTKKSWLKNLKLIKQSSLGTKLKASGDYFKSLFSKTRCSDESCAEAIRRNATEEVVSTRGNECLNKYKVVGKKNPFGQIQNQRHEMTASVMRATNEEKTNDDHSCSKRRSFSGVIKQCSSSSSNSSYSSVFSSANTNGFYELHLLKRSSSDNSETENAILGAIAHCKQTPVALLLKKECQ